MTSNKSVFNVISHKQLENADAYLKKHGYSAKFICSPMEAELDIPTNYFDFVYSIYGIGWTTDLQGTFKKIASYLQKDGIFIFSRSYFNESYFTMPVDGSEIVLCNRKISTYINALAEAGFCVEQMIEQTDNETMKSNEDEKNIIRKAKMLPISVCFKARKL